MTPGPPRRACLQKLHTYQGNYRAFKALIAAEYNGVDIQVPPFEIGTDNKTPEFLAKSPMGKVPVLETEEGVFHASARRLRRFPRARRPTRGHARALRPARARRPVPAPAVRRTDSRPAPGRLHL